ncbi:MAG: type II toxin-antitoxin system PemK/MazF family toxin, partial [Neisseriaceae bacterium]|nr:type II toxin-antitoxin system PemK/MazF family toxin [Neisseriaceae bacterium]
VTIEPSSQTGLQKVSQVMTDKLMTTKKEKIGQVIGTISSDTVKKIDQALILLLGLAR